jgi:antitoxin VapB
MVMRARLFKSGGSQAVRLPKVYRFEGQKEVLIYRQGGKVVLEGRRGEWSREFLALAGTAPDFPYRRRRRTAEPGPDLN